MNRNKSLLIGFIAMALALPSSACLLPNDGAGGPPPPPVPLPADSVGCVCPGVVGRMQGDVCEAPDDDMTEIMIPTDGAIEIVLPGCETENREFDDEMEQRACKADITSSNTLVLDFEPDSRFYRNEEMNKVKFDTEASDPGQQNPPQSADVSFTVVDAFSGALLKSGTVRVSDTCPTYNP